MTWFNANLSNSGGGGSDAVTFNINASHAVNPTHYDIVVTVTGIEVYSHVYPCTIYNAFDKTTDTFNYNNKTYTIEAQGFYARQGEKMLDVSINGEKESVYCSKQNSSYPCDDDFFIIVGDDAKIVIDEYLYFNNETVDTDVTLNTDHRIFVDFQLDEFLTQLQIVGNTAGDTQNFYSGLWYGGGSNRFYVRTSDGEHYQVLSDYTIRHTLDVNNNGKVYVDNVEWYNGVPNTNSSAVYTIGYRAADRKMTGKIFHFFIYDTVNDEYVIDCYPAHMKNVYGLYDTINDVFYPKQSR